jgi:predicted nucleotidyltransferase
LPTPEDLIILKAVAHRPKDLEDIREIVANNPNLDHRRIENWVKDFAELMETPELWGQIEKILKEQE